MAGHRWTHLSDDKRDRAVAVGRNDCCCVEIDAIGELATEHLCMCATELACRRNWASCLSMATQHRK